ncbi:formylglycine-generating enzyme family protein [Planococcus sp. CPCC 101016]|uniref:formylglycine-generating enzyme family protein n=1 Tax=Planococcus sp. CPCC 101016 TaxID=2599617 RepID=UPI0037C95C4A
MDHLAKPCCSPSKPRQLKETARETEVSLPTRKEIRFKEKMVFINGGEFLMGTESGEGHPADCEGPIRKRQAAPFYMDSTAVTNEEFKQFIKETGYQTEAEEFGWSFVFYQFLASDLKAVVRQVANTPWWCAVESAYWFQPEGPGSEIDSRMDHPVVHVSWKDANAFCEWAGKRLPDEIEWEYAASGGLEQKRYPWGDELNPNNEHLCNIWQGRFPTSNTAEDGFKGTAPVSSFLPNGFGLYNMAGNVWEWCSNAFTELRDPAVGQMKAEEDKAMRGGSYLCHDSYCNRYRVAARSSNTSDSSAGNIGFRCAADV